MGVLDADFVCTKVSRGEARHIAQLDRNGVVTCPLHGTYSVAVCAGEHERPVLASKCNSFGTWLCPDHLISNLGRPLSPTAVQQKRREDEMLAAGQRLLALREHFRPE